MGMYLCCWVKGKKSDTSMTLSNRPKIPLFRVLYSIPSNTLKTPQKMTTSHFSLTCMGYSNAIKIRFKNIFHH